MTPDTPADGDALAEAIAELPAEIMVWKSNPNLGHVGTWATTRYPEEAVAYVPRPAEPAQAAQVDANQRRADAATLLLDMLYMRNGAHEGLDRDAVEKMWNAVREDDGFPSVVQFLSVIAAAQEGRE